MGVSKYEKDEFTDFGEGFRAGMFLTVFVLFVLSVVAFLAHGIGKAERDRLEQRAEAMEAKEEGR